jgi:alpha-beta hydrolase superfamily lysophospholipase
MSPQAMLEERFTGSKNLTLFRRAWRPARVPRAILVNIHGLGDHSGLYPMVSDYFVPRGYAVHAPDLRGNGRSLGQRGYVHSWTDYRDDLGRFLGLVRQEEGNLPLFLLGNSLGALVALDYAQHHAEDLRGVIAVAPPLGRLGVPAPLLALGAVLSRVWPRFSLETGMDLTGLSRDPAVMARVLADPLFHRRGTARLSTEVRATIRRLHADAPHFPVPLLILHGSADRMVPPEGSRSYIQKVGHPDKQLLEYPESYHGLLGDLNGPEVLRDLEQWIERRM